MARLFECFSIAASLLLFTHAASGQTRPCIWPELKATPLNLDFAQGRVGAAPTAWLLGPEWAMRPSDRVHEALIVAADQCHSNPQCATIRSLRKDPSIPLSFLYQNLDATPYRGQVLVYRAFVRVDPSLGSVGRLLIRVHRKDCSTTFRDDMGDHPVTSRQWSSYEIRAPIAVDAYHIEFGLQLVGNGAVWIDQMSTAFDSTAHPQ